MERTDIIKLLTLMNSTYQYFTFPKADKGENKLIIDTWLSIFKQFDTELVMTAFREHITHEKEVPTPAHIMGKMKKMTTSHMDGNQAYAKLTSSIGRYGLYQAKECMDSLPVAIQNTVRLMGGLSIFANADEGDTYLKNSFIKNYEQAVEVEERERLLPEGVREQRKALLDKFRGNNNVKMLQ